MLSSSQAHCRVRCSSLCDRWRHRLRGRSDLPKAPHLGEGRSETQSCLVGVVSKTLPWKQMVIVLSISCPNLFQACSHFRHDPTLQITQMVLATHCSHSYFPGTSSIQNVGLGYSWIDYHPSYKGRREWDEKWSSCTYYVLHLPQA